MTLTEEEEEVFGRKEKEKKKTRACEFRQVDFRTKMETLSKGMTARKKSLFFCNVRFGEKLASMTLIEIERERDDYTRS